jgi:cobalt-zinc-cadmium efflux system membrane fusion protein
MKVNPLLFIINDPHSMHTATIFSINKAFEDNTPDGYRSRQNESDRDHLLPGMFIEARIQIDDYKSMALPDETVDKELISLR